MKNEHPIKILEILNDLYNQKPTGVLSTPELANKLKISIKEAQGVLIYLKEKDLINSYQNISGKWVQKINAKGLDELEKLESEDTLQDSLKFKDPVDEDFRLEKIEEKIQEVSLEKERRKGVAEQKFYGAVIELLDFQRNELKRREENSKEISELKSRIGKIEKLLTDNKENPSQEYQADETLISILQVPETANIFGNDEKSQAIEMYHQIKALREEVTTLERQVEKSNANSNSRNSLLKKIFNKQSEITKLKKTLSDILSSAYDPKRYS